MFALTNTLAAAGFVPARLEANMLAAVKAAGGSAWYVPDDFLVLGPELVVVNTASVAGASVYFYSDFTPVVGKSYQITYQYSVTGGTSVQMSLGGSNVPSSTVGSGTVVYTITATNTNPLRCYSNAATATLSGISVKEVLSAKDWQDSTGALASYFGGTVGLGFDMSGTLSAEKNTLPLSAWTLPAGFSSDANTIVCTAASTALSCYGMLGLASGKAHLITYTISEYLTGSVRPIASSGVVGAVRSANGTYTEIITPSAAAGNFGFQPWTTSFSGKITVNSVREIGGSPVSQATPGNRPVISRIPRKLGPELIVNGDFSAGLEGWSDASTAPSSISVASGVVRFNYTAGATARLQKQIATQAGKTYQITGLPSANNVYLAIGTQSGGGQNMANAIAVASSVFTATSATTWLNYSSAIDSATIDNVSVREVLEWSYALTFDGSNDSLAASASIIGSNLSQPYTMIAWGRPASINATRRAVGDNLRQLGIDAAGRTSLLHNTTGSKTGTYTHIAGQPVIIEAVWDGANVDLKTNGVTDGSGALAAPGGTLYATCIGQGGAGSNFWAGDVGGAAVCPAVMTDAQRAAVRKFAAAQMGMSL